LIVSTIARGEVSANGLLEILGDGKHTLHKEQQRSQSIGEIDRYSRLWQQQCLRMFRVLLSFLVLGTDETDCERRKAMMRSALIMIYL